MSETLPIEDTYYEFTIYFSDPVVLVRHGQDNKNLDTDLNPSLMEEKCREVVCLASSIVDTFRRFNCLNGITILTSPKLRSFTTAKMCKDCFDSEDIETKIVIEPSIKEIDQGRFIVDNRMFQGGFYKPLTQAWSAFREAQKYGDLFYRFGQPYLPVIDKTYPYLEEFFESLGENQVEFSTRIYKFLLDLASSSPNWLYLVVTHSGIVTRIRRIASLSMEYPKSMKTGEFITRAEQLGVKHKPNSYTSSVMIPRWVIKKAADEILTAELEYIIGLER